MAFEENKDLVRRYIEELFRKHDLDVMDEFLSVDYIGHQNLGTGSEERTNGREDFKEVVKSFFSAFPNSAATIEDMIEEGDKVVTRWVTRGTHEGHYMGVPPTQKEVIVSGIAIYRIADGKIAESWINGDMMGLMQQIGAFPGKKAFAETFKPSEEPRMEEVEASPH